MGIEGEDIIAAVAAAVFIAHVMVGDGYPGVQVLKFKALKTLI